MDIHDISWELRPTMAHWPGTKPPEKRLEAEHASGDPDEVSSWLINAHSGTHVDAPRHTFEGAASIESLPLEDFVGPVRVADVAYGSADGLIDRACIEEVAPREGERILFRTLNSMRPTVRDRFDRRFTAIGPDAAHALVEARVRTVGVDYLSIDPFMDPQETVFPAHRTLLAAKTAVIEGLDLSSVEPGDYHLCCLPLRLIDAEAAPARAILLSRDPAA